MEIPFPLEVVEGPKNRIHLLGMVLDTDVMSPGAIQHGGHFTRAYRPGTCLKQQADFPILDQEAYYYQTLNVEVPRDGKVSTLSWLVPGNGLGFFPWDFEVAEVYAFEVCNQHGYLSLI